MKITIAGTGYSVLTSHAHPERNKAIMANTDKVREFTEAGCWLQLTAGSLVGRFGPQAEQAAFDLIDAGWNCLAATDAHSLGLADA